MNLNLKYQAIKQIAATARHKIIFESKKFLPTNTPLF
jgi:hypothetical protein